MFAVNALAQEAARLARRAAASGSAENEGAGAAALDAIRNFGWHLACCRPQMVPIANSVAAVLAAAHDDLRSRCAARVWLGCDVVYCHDGCVHVRQPKSAFCLASFLSLCITPNAAFPTCRRADAFAVPLGEVCGVVQQHAAAEQQRLAGAAAQLRQQVLGLLWDGMTVMTCSLSSTVLAAVKEAVGGLRLWGWPFTEEEYAGTCNASVYSHLRFCTDARPAVWSPCPAQPAA